MRFQPEDWPTLSHLLDTALELEPEAREHWLESLPAADLPYREKLRELLRQHAAAAEREFLETIPKFSGTGADGTDAQLTAGAQIGPYTLEEEIGRGGMGAVWRARRADGVLNRNVALKLPHVGAYGTELVERFAREREILARLAHPNIARLYDAGFSASGQPYLALEYVAGLPLTQYCDVNRLDVRRRLEIFLQVLRAVQYAHRHLVIHRDLKPSNVMVTAEGQAMLLDFGIAKLMQPEVALEEPGSGLRTQLGAAPLTPDYASPEQVGREQATTATDVYSSGVLLFELLTGNRPYRLKRASRASLEEAILTAEPPRPSQFLRDGEHAERGTSSQGLARTLRGDLDTVVLKALKKSPGERYASADAFAQDIQHYLRREPVTARPDSNWYRAGKFVARHKLPVAASAGAMAAILAVAGIALYEARQAGLQRDRALALSARSVAVTDFLDVLITEAAQAEKPVSVSDMLVRSEALANSEYRADPPDRAAVLGMLGIHYHTMGDDSRSEPLLREALAAAQTSSDRDLIRQLKCDHAMALAGQGSAAQASSILEDVIADTGTTPQQSAMCLEYLAFIAQDAADPPDAIRYGYAALDRLSHVKNPSPVTHAMFLGSVGYAEHLSSHNAVANRYYEQALAELTRVGRERGPDAVTVRNNWAIVSDGAGEPRRSLALYDQTLAIVSQDDPGAHVPAYLLGNRAKALDTLGRLTQARAGYLRCVAEAERAKEKAPLAFCLLGLAAVAREQGDWAAAGDLLDRVAALIGGQTPPGFPPTIALKAQRGELALASGNAPQAQAELDAAISEARNPFLTIGAREARAELYASQGNSAAAEADARLALQMSQEQQGGVPYSNRTGSAWLTLGKVLAGKQDRQGAAQALQAAVAHLSNTVDEQNSQLLEARQLASVALAR